MTAPAPLPEEQRLAPDRFQLRFNPDDGTIVLWVTVEDDVDMPIVEVVVYDTWNGEDDYHIGGNAFEDTKVEPGSYALASWTPGFNSGEYHRIWESNYRTGTEED